MENLSVAVAEVLKTGKSSSCRYYGNNGFQVRQTLVDTNEDGVTNSVSYFLDGRDGKCITSCFDYDNDGKIDAYIDYEYGGNKLVASFTDLDNDGEYDSSDWFDENGAIKRKEYYKYADGYKAETAIFYDKDGKEEYSSYRKYKIAEYDNDTDSKPKGITGWFKSLFQKIFAQSK